jgi:hypothetical protein
MAINLATLKTEAQLPKYSGWVHRSIADDLNARTIAADVDVSIVSINRRLIGQGIFGKLDARIAYYGPKVGAAVAVNGVDEVKLAMLHTAKRSLELLPSYEMSNAQTKTFIQNMLADLVTEGIMTNPQRTQLLALASGLVSRSEQLFGEPVAEGHVTRALAS